jgi:beta-xylosidase
MYATHSQVDLQVWYSDDLENWTQGPTVWTPTQTWQTEGPICGIWAPHVEPAGDRFYMYYSANCRIGLAVADNPLGPFVDVYDHPLVGNGWGGVGDGIYQNKLYEDWNDLAIDAFVLRTADERMFLFHNAFTPFSTVHAQEMTDFVTVSGDPQVMLEPDVGSWEGFIREGTWVIEHEGVFHLMYSGNMYDTTEYAMGVATATAPMGPYTRDPRNPILKTNMETGIYGPGHHSVSYDGNGEPLIFYHTKVSPDQGDLRAVRYGPLWFDEQGRVNVEQP